MIISFDGSLISGDLVYKITKIDELYETNRRRTGCYDLEHREPFKFSFSLVFINGQTDTFIEKANYDPKEVLTKEEYDTTRATELATKAGNMYRETDEYKKQRARIEGIYNLAVKNIEADKSKTLIKITE